ncbi:S1 family peptidase [Streptomyces tendae]
MSVIFAVSASLVALTSPAAPSASPLSSNPVKAAEVAAHLGRDRTAGIYSENGHLVITVTDEDAAETVRRSGGVAEMVTHSAAELESVHAELDGLAGIPNTSWGIDPSENVVTVSIHDGVSDRDRARIERVARKHDSVVRIDEQSGSILPAATYYMRGGMGIEDYDGHGLAGPSSGGGTCSAAFNVENASGNKRLLTAGHCVIGGSYEWQRSAGGVYLGAMESFEYEPGDWAVIDYQNDEVVPVGSLQLRDESEQSITASRYPVVGEAVKRLGTISQDLVGKVIANKTTVNYETGETIYNLTKTDLCAMAGDSGGPLYSGLYALGILSAGNYLGYPCGNSHEQSGRYTWFQPVRDVLIENNLEIY